MWKERLARITGLLAALTFVLALVACGGTSGSNHSSQSAPIITTQPVGPTVTSGQNATLTVTASGAGTLSYQWYQGPSGTTSNPISGATSNTYTTPNLTATTSYWAQVSSSTGSVNSNTAVVLIAGPRQAQALLSGDFASQPYFSTFTANILPNISGVSVALQWNQIETTQGTYDFTSFDTGLQPFAQAGRAVNLIVWPATEGGSNSPGNGGSTPGYVFTQQYASQVAASSPQDMTVCESYQGDSGSPYGQANFTSGGIWNSSDPTYGSDLSGLPVSYELPFMTAYKNLIQAVILHYNQAGSTINGVPVPQIGYIRFGFSQGGENSPECNQYWPNFSQTTYVTNYVAPMTQWVAQQNPKMTILEDMHALGNLGSESASVYIAYPDQEAQIGVANGMGIGTNGLQQSDITNLASQQPCDSDWCNMFALYSSTKYNGTPITLSLQTLQWTDPTEQNSSNPTGSLVQIEPFAKANAANNLELYLADVAIAFDPANYCSYPHSACSSIAASNYASTYAAAIQDFMAP
jgi:hypothetical protein